MKPGMVDGDIGASTAGCRDTRLVGAEGCCMGVRAPVSSFLSMLVTDVGVITEV